MSNKILGSCPNCERKTNVFYGVKSICFSCYRGKELKIYSAFSTYIEKRGWTDYFQGYVISPTYCNKIKLSNRSGIKKKYMVDNGAYSDYQNQVKINGYSILERTLKLCDRVVENNQEVRFMVLPDYLGDWKSTYEFLKEMEPITYFGYDFNVALPIQEGFQLSEIQELIEIHKPSILFIGGKTIKFKKEAVKKLSIIDLKFHVGRIHRVPDLCYFAKQFNVESVDTSSYAIPVRDWKSKGYKLEAFNAWLYGNQKTLEGYI